MKNLNSEVAGGYGSDIQPMKLSASQELALQRASRLVIGNTYLFPAQAFHTKPMESSPTGISNRAVAYEIDAAGNFIGIKTLSYSALRAAYLGKVTDDSEEPVVESEDRDGVTRAKRGTVSFISNIKGGSAPIQPRTINGVQTAVIASPFALKVTGRSEYYTTSLERRDDGRYDMVARPDGYLAIETRNDYDFEYVVPTKEQLAEINMAKDMPELKDYAL